MTARPDRAVVSRKSNVLPMIILAKDLITTSLRAAIEMAKSHQWHIAGKIRLTSARQFSCYGRAHAPSPVVAACL